MNTSRSDSYGVMTITPYGRDLVEASSCPTYHGSIYSRGYRVEGKVTQKPNVPLPPPSQSTPTRPPTHAPILKATTRSNTIPGTGTPVYVSGAARGLSSGSCY